MLPTPSRKRGREWMPLKVLLLLHLGEVSTEASNEYGWDDHNDGIVEHNLVLAHLQNGEGKGRGKGRIRGRGREG